MALKPILPGNVVPVPSATVGKGFSAHMSTSQVLITSTWQKIQFDTSDFDTTGGYNTGSYRWTPVTSGAARIVSIGASIELNEFAAANIYIAVYKNGSLLKKIRSDQVGTGPESLSIQITEQAAANDYYEIFVFDTGNGLGVISGDNADWFSGFIL
jgi:hypothetical protein